MDGVPVYYIHVAHIDHALLFEDYRFLNLVVDSMLAPMSHTNTIPAAAPATEYPEDDFLTDDLEQPYIPNPPPPTLSGLTLADLDRYNYKCTR
ncbi:hypothetical protein F0562_023728 [Nyssa sinensis]|uniref:Uncharacterized protein n=1 Tax=Nyssa sinensis TaxID=561372 RepID=A0A5J5BIU7_9ASTE|nr:hypothetical protein F0562_023728 [Nyssa sinensis]